MVLVPTLTRNEDNTNRFMRGVWFKNCSQPTVHKHQRWTKYMSPVYLFKCTPMHLSPNQPSTKMNNVDYTRGHSTGSSVLQGTCHQCQAGESYSKSLETKLEGRIDSKCQFCPDKRTWFFSHNTTWLSRHGWDKFCGFIHYNVQYVMYIVAYVILKLQFDPSLTYV